MQRIVSKFYSALLNFADWLSQFRFVIRPEPRDSDCPPHMRSRWKAIKYMFGIGRVLAMHEFHHWNQARRAQRNLPGTKVANFRPRG